MAQTTCRVYFNTGFNAVNIPDSPALLNLMSFADAAVLDLNQERFLPMVRIRSDWNTVKNGDYCKVGDFFYFIDNIYMSSGDVAELTLTPDFVTSAGGPASLEIIDGVTNRVHVTDDSYGIYTEEDPYMQPAYDMDIAVDVTTGDFSGSSYTFVETTLDLITLGHYLDSGATPPAVTAVSDTQAEVTYPVAAYIPGDIKTDYVANIGGTAYSLPDTNGQVLYWRGDTESPALSKGINVARSLGIEQSISAQFNIPAGFIAAPSLSTPIIGTLTGVYRVNVTSGVPFVYGTANNNRVFYGSQSKYTLVSCAGSSMSANAEEIYDGSANPSVLSFADPRREGKPYFRFNPLNGVSALTGGKHKDAFRNCVAGIPWRSVPMVFTDKSGGMLDQIRFNSSQQMSDLAFQQAGVNRQLSNAMTGALVTANLAEGKMSGAVSATMAGAQTELNYQQYKDRMLLQKAQETQQFQISQNVNVPDIHFAIDPQLCADVMGNGFFVARAIYKAEDIARIDKILTAYGYKFTKQLTAGDFSSRTYFNYVEASITVGNLPKWWADGVAAQISNGVRVWHVKPNHSYYANNPVRV